MSENFNTYIDHIQTDFWRELCVREGKLRHFERGEVFAKAGEVAPYMGYIKSGALKYVANSADGTEHVVALVFEGGFVTDWRYSRHSLKSKVTIVAVSDCEIYTISTKFLKEKMDSEPQFRQIVMGTTEALYSTLYDRFLDLYIKTPQQRYEELLARSPHLFTLFSLKDIASFLNITPTHLSRLRNKNNSRMEL